MSKYLVRIEKLLSDDSFIISMHARVRMFERNVSTDDLVVLLKNGEIIEEYFDDQPCPSVLILGYINNQPYHLVVGFCEDHLRIITVYVPDEYHWIEYKIRRKSE